MSIDELLRNTNGISVTVSLDDLRQLFSEIARKYSADNCTGRKPSNN